MQEQETGWSQTFVDGKAPLLGTTVTTRERTLEERPPPTMANLILMLQNLLRGNGTNRYHSDGADNCHRGTIDLKTADRKSAHITAASGVAKVAIKVLPNFYPVKRTKKQNRESRRVEVFRNGRGRRHCCLFSIDAQSSWTSRVRSPSPALSFSIICQPTIEFLAVQAFVNDVEMTFVRRKSFGRKV
jgi:hypothetical protein